jgi:hemerythrin-like domain-containing protein
MTDCCQLLIAQHAETRRLLGLLEESLKALTSARGELASVKALHEALVLDLGQHFVLEEQGLFETVNQYRSMILMEVEHDDLLALQKALGEAIHSLGDVVSPSALEVAIERFLAFQDRLLAHMREEEAGIFPLVQRWLEPEEQQKVLRRFSELQAELQTHKPKLSRPTPGFDIFATKIFQPIARPIGYEILYEREHALLQHLTLQAGRSLAPHWAGQHQCVLLISGSVLFETSGHQQKLEPGMLARLESRLTFSFTALEDSHLVVFKIWPHPHFTKA